MQELPEATMPEATKEDHKGQRSNSGDTCEMRNTVPTLVATVVPRRHRLVQDVYVTLLCPRSHPSAADDTMRCVIPNRQPEQAPFDSQLNDGSPGGGASPQSLRQTKYSITSETRSLRLAANAANRTPTRPCQSAVNLSGAANINKDPKAAEVIGKGQSSCRDWCHDLYRLNTGEQQTRYSLGDYRLPVRQAMAHAPVASAETLHGTTRFLAATVSTGACHGVQPSAPFVDRSSSSHHQAQPGGVTSAAVEQAPRSPEKNSGDRSEPHADALMFAVNDEMRFIYERNEMRWGQVGRQRRAHRRGRYVCVLTGVWRMCHPAREVRTSGSGAQLQ